jgi:hypothetical protein
VIAERAELVGVMDGLRMHESALIHRFHQVHNRTQLHLFLSFHLLLLLGSFLGLTSEFHL